MDEVVSTRCSLKHQFVVGFRNFRRRLSYESQHELMLPELCRHELSNIHSSFHVKMVLHSMYYKKKNLSAFILMSEKNIYLFDQIKKSGLICSIQPKKYYIAKKIYIYN